jgi:uncharacterized protein YndB with AHSA1/START domain
MTGDSRILGRLREADGMGIVRVEDRLDTDIDDAWSALTDPTRLAHWYGEITGDLRLGGEYRARLYASGWEGVGRVQACEPPRRLVVLHQGADEPNERATEVTLTPDGDQTILVIEQRGVPVSLLPAYGAGMQVHVEDLGAHLAGQGRCDSKTRWDELFPGYQKLAPA